MLSLWLVVLVSCDQKPPDRSQIPILKQKLFRLQEAVKAQNRAAIDSLLSVQILSIGQSSDSLLRFTFGPGGNFDFRQFAMGEIVYTGDKARIDCWIMDSTKRKNRPLKLTWVHEHEQWLLKKFEPGELDTLSDSNSAG